LLHSRTEHSMAFQVRSFHFCIPALEVASYVIVCLHFTAIILLLIFTCVHLHHRKFACAFACWSVSRM
jgi:hypothetical protein